MLQTQVHTPNLFTFGSKGLGFSSAVGPDDTGIACIRKAAGTARCISDRVRGRQEPCVNAAFASEAGEFLHTKHVQSRAQLTSQSNRCRVADFPGAC